MMQPPTHITRGGDLSTLFEWDVENGPGGVAMEKDDALGYLTDALRSATGPSTGRILEVALPAFASEIGYVPLRRVATAVRDARGAITWTMGATGE